MNQITKKDLLGLIAELPDGEQKRRIIAKLIQTNQVTEEDVAAMVVEDMRRNFEQYAKAFQENDFLRLLWYRFQDYPQYLARALVRVSPDIFYAYGFTFRLIMKLRANLGQVVIPPVRPSDSHNSSTYFNDLPKMVQSDLFALDRERCFRQYLWLFSRDPKIGFELLTEDIQKATSEFDQRVLNDLRDYCVKLLDMRFPDFIGEINGSVFPSFHVRWWIDQMEEQRRVLCMGGTGTQKTAFSTVAMRYYGYEKVLVFCAAHAKSQWKREIETYFRNPKDRVSVLNNSGKLSDVANSKAQYLVVGYPSLINREVVETLKTIPFTGLIWDECHYAKNVIGSSASERGKACSELISSINPACVTALSATPWENHPLELGIIATTLCPEIFPSVSDFHQAHPEDPRFLRELLAPHILDVELREIKDLPPVSPKPWEDLSAADLIPMNQNHHEVYEAVREDESVELESRQKVVRLLRTAIQPHAMSDVYSWEPPLTEYFKDWRLSTKLEWLKGRIERELEIGAKVVVATGIYVEGITRPENSESDDEIWAGKLLKDWFGQESVLILDQTVSQNIGRSGISDRDCLIKEWRTNPRARILLVSMRTCPDSVNLSVPALDGITKLFVTAFSYPWVPWKQFQGRFWREGLGVPLEYCVPVLEDTIDESLLRLVDKKWQTQELFRAHVPLTQTELEYLGRRVDMERLAQDAKSDLEHVNIIGNAVRGRGEEGAKQVLEDSCGTSTNAIAFARSFLATQQYSTSGHISRFMKPVIEQMQEQGLVHTDGILDAGCGPLTLERRLEAPIYGVDFNRHMIELGCSISKCQGKNARVGILSQLSKEWTAKFELTVASLVLDWSSLRERKGESPERLSILSELVRVTHPYGRIWLTATEQSMDELTMSLWIEELRSMGFVIVDELTGLVSAKGLESARKPFSFWSLCFSPNNHHFVSRHPQAYRFLFEMKRLKSKCGGQQDKERIPKKHQKVVYNNFDLRKISGLTIDMREVVQQATEHEVKRLTKQNDLKGWRFHRAPNLGWRVLQELRERGLLDDL